MLVVGIMLSLLFLLLKCVKIKEGLDDKCPLRHITLIEEKRDDNWDSIFSNNEL